MKDYYSVKEFAKLLGIHPNTVRNMIKRNQIESFRVGDSPKSNIRISQAQIEKFILVSVNRPFMNFLSGQNEE